MITLTERQKKIIKILLDNTTYLTMTDISKILDLSTRTILRDFKSIERWFKENDFNLNIKTGVGLIIDENQEIRNYILELLYFDKINVYSKIERNIFIISTLLYNKEPVKMNYFTKTLNISKNTLDDDLNNIKNNLNNFDIILEKKQGLGCYIIGKEENLRNCYLNMILEYFRERVDLIECLKNIFITQEKSIFFKHNIILKIFDKDFLLKISNCINYNIRDLEIVLTDDSYIEFIIHLAVAVKRNNNNFFENDINYNSNKFFNTIYFDIINSICINLENEFNIIFSIEEKLFITKIFKTLKFMKMEYLLDNSDILDKTKKFINLVEEDLKISLISDKTFLNDLLNHLESAIYRMKLKLAIENPFLDEIKNQYSEIYKSIKNNIVFIKNCFNIDNVPEEEIGYITMHFIVPYEKILKNVNIDVVICCHTGVGTSKILLKELKEKFSNINVLEVIPAFKIREYDTPIDLIISTINIDTNKTFIKLNPILDSEDEKNLKDIILNIAKNKILDNNENEKNYTTENIDKKEISKILNLSEDINNIIKKYNHFIYRNISDIEILLDNISEILLDDISNKNILKDDLKKRIDIQVPYFEEFDLLYLHCISNVINNIKLITIKLEQAISFSEENIKYILVVVIPKNINNYQNQLLSEISINIINNPKFVEAIKFSEKEEIIAIIKNFLLNFYQEKIKEII